MILEQVISPMKKTVDKISFINDMPDWIIVGFTFIAILISLISFIIAYKSYILAKKIENKNNPQFSLYLKDSGIIKNESHALYIFEIIISNLSSSNNSVKLIELRINYRLDNLKANIIFTHDNSLLSQFTKQSQDDLPINIDAGTSEKVTAIFTVDDKLRQQFEINSYELIVTDTFDKKETIETNIICEVNSIE